MALTSWKLFRFFDVSQVQLPEGDGSVALDQTSASCIEAGSSNIFVGTPHGLVHCLDQNFKVTRSWKAHQYGVVNNIKQVPGTAYVFTTAEDLTQEPELKVWNLDEIERRTGHPRCLCTLTVQNGRKNDPITAFAVTNDVTQLAVGFGNGAVTVVRGDFIHDRGTKQRTVFESKEPITGLEFREANITALYIATTSRILALQITGNRQGTPAKSVDEHGCDVGCMTLEPESNDIVVARDDAIYFYRPRSTPTTYAYQGAKKLVQVSKDYVLLVSPPKSGLTKSAPLRAFAGSQADDILNTSSLTILNTDLRFIAHQESLSSQVKCLLSMWGDIFLFTIDGKVYRYHEKTFQQKLDILYQRNLFPQAINMAQKYRVDKVQQNIIYRKFGDYLYQKGDYDTAMQQYLSAIDNTEPSHIIRKFLDNQTIKHLIEYLEELHEHGKATSDHTTLLLNCYAKLENIDKLEAFIRQPGDLKFDLDTAIVMCRQGGYYDQAAFLARRHNEHSLVVDILVEDLKKYAEALAYIVRLEPTTAYPIFMRYGVVLLEHCGRDATQLFIDYFTGVFKPKKDALIVQEAPAAQESGGFGTIAQSAVQNLAALIPLPYMSMNTSKPRTPEDGSKTMVNKVVETTTEADFIEYEIPKPRAAFPAFVDHADEFIVFLEACTESDNVKPEDKSDLFTSLFEMYLHKASNTTGSEKAEWERKARVLIESQSVPIDTSSVLLLSDLEKFRDGTILVSEKQGRRFDVFRSYTTALDTRGAIKALHKYGPEEPQLYPAALAYFTSSPEILEEAGSEVGVVLKKISDDGLMAPLQVIQTLSTNAVATMGLVKEYLSATVEKEKKEISDNRNAIAGYRKDTTNKLQEIDELSSKPTAFNATRCSYCGVTLDLPTVHFLCKHSFHQRCLDTGEGQGVNDVECPKCAAENEAVKEIRRAQLERAGKHDLFTLALNQSSDKFGTVSEWFGRGVMDVQPAVAD
ncbi:vacuolar protein sorting protein-like protein [Neohortaea acidophila]|uniref:E3 ubiquitin-protein ligase PEP5 n=1 Tax=Neohortaea acidophila TaxID=245834 RepID=A0A6A6PSW6_9PEZI|nr:vacuolar protein sorting protein-like protein [Neohortaea acidophila]KAF2483190.1 vacuolar protein sorting protein-like protein [Neohortaea acidophila]